MKKKILFMVINMNVGGTEKALLNMISELPQNEYEITILMLEEYGGFLSAIPSEVKIEYVRGYKKIKEYLQTPLHIKTLNTLKKGNVIKFVRLLYIYLMCKALKEKSTFYKYILEDCDLNENEYDIAVAYAGPMDLISYFIAKKVKAKKKIQWIHFDITKIGFNKSFAAKIYKHFDKIFVVSDEGKNKLMNIIPEFKEKIDKFLNVISPKLIMKLSVEGKGFEDDFNGIRILTVGRLSEEKGQDITIRVLSRLREEGYNVKWYCIGEGRERKNYELLIKEYNLENNYILLGANPNPYPFMRQCDIYVQSSRHEGYCITLSEAKCLGAPIVSTNFTGANEQIKHNNTGLIVRFDETQLYSGIKKLLDEQSLRIKFNLNLKNECIDTTSEINKLIEL